MVSRWAIGDLCGAYFVFARSALRLSMLPISLCASCFTRSSCLHWLPLLDVAGNQELLPSQAQTPLPIRPCFPIRVECYVVVVPNLLLGEFCVLHSQLSVGDCHCSTESASIGALSELAYCFLLSNWFCKFPA